MNKRQLLTGATATGAGIATSLDSGRFSVQIAGITTATVKVQVSNDGSNWHDLATATADGIYSNADGCPYAYVRANVSAYTSGTINVILVAA